MKNVLLVIFLFCLFLNTSAQETFLGFHQSFYDNHIVIVDKNNDVIYDDHIISNPNGHGLTEIIKLEKQIKYPIEVTIEGEITISLNPDELPKKKCFVISKNLFCEKEKELLRESGHTLSDSTLNYIPVIFIRVVKKKKLQKEYKVQQLIKNKN